MLAIEGVDGHKNLFAPNVLPFRASSSVYVFNLAARSLQMVKACLALSGLTIMIIFPNWMLLALVVMLNCVLNVS